MFDRLRRTLGETSRPVDVFFRDDDADADVAELRTLLAIFGSRNVPLSLAVIPGTLNQGGVDLLREAHRAQPLELHQHGWMHVNHEADGRKCEFGGSRTPGQQYEDIGRGWERLVSLFHGAVSPVFTPPWNRCTSATRQALQDLGFRVLSRDRGHTPEPPPPAEVSICVDIFRWKCGPRLKAPDEIESEAVAAIGRREPLGVLLHHKVMKADAFGLTAGLIDALRSGPGVRFHAVEGLCEKPS